MTTHKDDPSTAEVSKIETLDAQTLDSPMDGETAMLVRAFDWASTPLGAAVQWPRSLKTVVDLLLTSRFSMWMAWGPELAFFYNDAYARDTLGKKHPWALGRPARVVWAEIWDDIGPRIESVIETGRATWDQALLLFLERSGYTEETYHTFSYSPLRGDDGRIAGMFCVVMEETERVIGERRLGTLRELAAALATTTSDHEVSAAVELAIGTNLKDLPFTATYLFDADGKHARLSCTTGISAGDAAAPPVIDVESVSEVSPWPIADLLAKGAPIVVEGLAHRFRAMPTRALPTRAWNRPPERAVVLPIAQQGQDRPAGFLVVGLNPFRPFDAAYGGFVDLVAGQIAASLGNARAYEAERTRAETLAELDRAKTIFFSNVSHELRTPLTLLLGPIENTMHRDLLPAAAREELDLAYRNALRLLKLVNTLLDFSRIEAGRVEAVFEPTDLASYTAELASSFRSVTERAGLRLVVDTSSETGSLANTHDVYVDRDMWEKIVLNLLSNAFKHTFQGEIAVGVRATGDGRAELTVRDTGVGIPAVELPHLFERFHRVPNARSRTHEGSGIGLALVQELVRLHGGEIAVESAQEVGTLFTVRIPLGTAHLAQERIGGRRGLASTALTTDAFTEEAMRWLPDTQRHGNSEETANAFVALGEDGALPGTANEESNGARPRILLADDNSDMREYAGRLLRSRGWSVEVVPDGQAALEAARRERPALVVSDILMPNLDGFELLKALRVDPATRSVPVILLSARAGEESRIEGLDAGADDYLIKPFSARELVARVGAHLKLAQARERALADVAAVEARLRTTFTQAPVAIAVVRGPDHRFEIANEAYLDLVGHRTLVGLSVREALPELEGQEIYGLLDGVLDTREPFVGNELRVLLDRTRRGDVEERFFNFVYQPLLDPRGDVDGIAIVATDVTELVLSRRAAEAATHAAMRSQAGAEEANRVKSDFLAAMSHELRTPLNAIAGHVQLVEMGIHGPVTSAQREALARVQRSEQLLLSLVNDVLNFAKLEAGRVEYEIGVVVLKDVVTHVVSMIEPQFTAKGLTYEIYSTANAVVRADGEKVEQILLNLLSNAAKFTEPGGAICVETGVSGDNTSAARDQAFARVTDTGIGIPSEKLETVFDPFVQVHRNRTRLNEGTGLGLAISRDLARGMGGDLTVESTVGKGSRFTLMLPRGTPDVRDVTTDAASAASDSALSGGGVGSEH